MRGNPRVRFGTSAGWATLWGAGGWLSMILYRPGTVGVRPRSARARSGGNPAVPGDV